MKGTGVVSVMRAALPFCIAGAWRAPAQTARLVRAAGRGAPRRCAPKPLSPQPRSLISQQPAGASVASTRAGVAAQPLGSEHRAAAIVAEWSPGPCRALPPASATRPLGDDTACPPSSGRTRSTAPMAASVDAGFMAPHSSCHRKPAAAWCEVMRAVLVVGCDFGCSDAKESPAAVHDPSMASSDARKPGPGCD
jgi:hypothetical protein